jgi:hypothetical protein
MKDNHRGERTLSFLGNQEIGFDHDAGLDLVADFLTNELTGFLDAEDARIEKGTDFGKRTQEIEPSALDVCPRSEPGISVHRPEAVRRNDGGQGWSLSRKDYPLGQSEGSLATCGRKSGTGSIASELAVRAYRRQGNKSGCECIKHDGHINSFQTGA